MTRPAALVSSLLFLGTLLAVLAIDVENGMFGELLEAHPPTLATLSTGRFARQADSWVTRESQAMRHCRPYWNGLSLELFCASPDYVIAGRDDWLFSKPSLMTLTERITTVETDRAIGGLLNWKGIAESAGARVLVFVIPSKWRFHEEMLLGPPVAGDRQGLYGEIVAGLRSRDIATVDVLAKLKAARDEDGAGPFFLPNDTHLGQEGFRVVTEKIICPLLEIDQATAHDRLEAIPTENRLHAGNLPELMSLPTTGLLAGRWSVEERHYLAPPPANEADTDIVMLGDSYLTYYDRLFARLIQSATRWTVDARNLGGKAAGKRSTKAPRWLIFVGTEHSFAAFR